MNDVHIDLAAAGLMLAFTGWLNYDAWNHKPVVGSPWGGWAVLASGLGALIAGALILFERPEGGHSLGVGVFTAGGGLYIMRLGWLGYCFRDKEFED